MFAALDVATGMVIGQTHRRYQHQEFLRFFKVIDEATPAELDLLLMLGNFATPKPSGTNGFSSIPGYNCSAACLVGLVSCGHIHVLTKVWGDLDAVVARDRQHVTHLALLQRGVQERIQPVDIVCGHEAHPRAAIQRGFDSHHASRGTVCMLV